MAVALLLEAVLLLLLLSLGWSINQPTKPKVVEVQFKSSDYSESEDETPEPDQKQQPATAQPEEAPIEKPVVVTPAPIAPTVIPIPRVQPVAPPPPAPPVGPRPIQKPQPGMPSYGPPNTGSSGAMGDTEIVGTAPNGEPLYKAAWYKRPTDDELDGYLSTASGPGWGLIACRTAPDYRVEDCVPLAEYPQGSMMNRAILAATWQFKVRPPRRGGKSLVGSWVRIRIDYGMRPE
jgi:protein TonB